MRIAILGGTDFIGPAIVEALVAANHEVTVVHRGQHERPGLPPTAHIHCDRRDGAALKQALAGHDGVVDTCAYSTLDAQTLVSALPANARVIVLGSMDVYRAYGSVMRGEAASDPIPLDEDSPVRTERHLYRGQPAGVLRGLDTDTYEKLDVEGVVRPAGALMLRLAVVYGPRDHLARENFILGRVRAGRRRIPFGAGNLVWTRVYVHDVAQAVRLAVESRALPGGALNIGERRMTTVEQWARKILEIAGAEAELVRVPSKQLPRDLAITGSFRQHMIFDSARAREVLGFRDTDPEVALRESVRWHLEHPPTETPDFSADDNALAASRA